MLELEEKKGYSKHTSLCTVFQAKNTNHNKNFPLQSLCFCLKFQKANIWWLITVRTKIRNPISASPLTQVQLYAYLPDHQFYSSLELGNAQRYDLEVNCKQKLCISISLTCTHRIKHYNETSSTTIKRPRHVKNVTLRTWKSCHTASLGPKQVE